MSVLIKAITLLAVLLIQISQIACEGCLKVDISLTQKVENEGFHRDIRWLLETSSSNMTAWLGSQCKLALYVGVNGGMYVNKYEVDEVNLHKQISIRVEGDVNIEAPAHESHEHAAYIYLPLAASERVVFNLPIHLRYQRAQITGKLGKVHLGKPTLLVLCPKDVVLCGKRRPIVEAPCSFLSSMQCKWKNTTYHALFEEVELFLPIGDLDDYPLVAVVTLLLGCIGCIYVLSILATAPL